MPRAGNTKSGEDSHERAEQYRKFINQLRNEDYWLLLQLVPEVNRDTPICFCHGAGCQQENGIVLPGDFMLSLERRYHPDGTLGRMTILPAREARKEPRGPTGLRGVGLSGQEHYCLMCMEWSFRENNERGGPSNTEGFEDRFDALFTVADRILADERECLDYPGYFQVNSAYKYGLELWKAVKLYDQARLDGGTQDYSEEESGIDFTFADGTSVKAAIRPADVRNRQLSQVLSLVRTKIAEHSNGTIPPVFVKRIRDFGFGPPDHTLLTMYEISLINEFHTVFPKRREHPWTSSELLHPSSLPADRVNVRGDRQRESNNSPGMTPGHQDSPPNTSARPVARVASASPAPTSTSASTRRDTTPPPFSPAQTATTPTPSAPAGSKIDPPPRLYTTSPLSSPAASEADHTPAPPPSPPSELTNKTRSPSPSTLEAANTLLALAAPQNNRHSSLSTAPLPSISAPLPPLNPPPALPNDPLSPAITSAPATSTPFLCSSQPRSVAKESRKRASNASVPNREASETPDIFEVIDSGREEWAAAAAKNEKDNKRRKRG